MKILKRFAVFEGGDGSGRTTQLNLLRDAGIPKVWTTVEPTDGPIGQLIRQVLRGDIILRPETIARLFASDRNEHLYASGGIVERCRCGEFVVSDRYVLSSLVYQGIMCGDAFTESLNHDFPLPELLFFFEMDPEAALERIRDRPQKDLYEYIGMQTRVIDRYKKLIPRYKYAGCHVEILDALESPEKIAEKILKTLKSIMKI